MKKNTFLSLCLAFSLIIPFSSCEYFDEEEPIPSYIQIDTIALQAQSAQGSSSHRISDAWIFVNNQLIGAFELPALAPILEEGDQEIEVFAGVSENGIASFREVYPFYARYKVTKNLERGGTINLSPMVVYDQRTVFAFIEGFETSNIFGEELDGNPATTLEVTSQGRFEGSRSGKVVLTQTHNYFESATSTFYQLPIDEINNPIYIELNYRNNTPFEIGLIGYKNNQEVGRIYAVGLNPKDEWNKVYLNITDQAFRLNADLYQVSIRAIKSGEVEIGEIFLDNIKLLHF